MKKKIKTLLPTKIIFNFGFSAFGSFKKVYCTFYYEAYS
jgi:hypothetical protein